jgi:hypothetical protein
MNSSENGGVIRLLLLNLAPDCYRIVVRSSFSLDIASEHTFIRRGRHVCFRVSS